MTDQIPKERIAEHRLSGAAFLLLRPLIFMHRGDLDQAQESFAAFPQVTSSADIQERATHAAGRAALLLGQGETAEALAVARQALEFRGMGLAHESGREGVNVALEAAFRLGDHDALGNLLDWIDGVPRGMLPPILQAQAMRYRAKLAAARRDDASVEPGLKGAAGLFREIVNPFQMAVTLLDHGEWLVRSGRPEEARPLLEEARTVFERLQATPWIDRVDRIAPSVAAGAQMS
jgi:tetratricopeptide (TPR) repeat protein